MPVYQFKCDNPDSPYFKQPLEKIMTIKDYLEQKEKLKCPVTGFPLRPVMGRSMLKFKGPGFYVTDKNN